MSVADYMTKMIEIQKNLIEFIDAEDNPDLKYSTLKALLIDHEINNDKNELQLLLQMLVKISDNHHRGKDFFNKINQILILFKDDIMKYFTISEIFNIFQSNKRMVLLLIEDQFFSVDQSTSEKLKHLKYSGKYFKLECKPFEKEDPNSFELEFDYLMEMIMGTSIDEIKQRKKNNKMQEDTPEIFDEKRKIGENDSVICKLIRNDSLDEFIEYINKTNFSITDANINDDDFETNQFLIKNKDISLIEYAAFFGSMKIIKYLFVNNVDLTSSLWLYAIHGNNYDLIHFLEENNIEPKNKAFNECLIEAIKCHHNEIANYIIENYLENEKNDIKFLQQCIKYYNFAFLPQDNINRSLLYDLCRYNYFWLVNNLLSNENIDINMTIISKHIYFYKI